MAIYILNDGSWKESIPHTAYPHKALVIKTPPANAGGKSCEFDPWVGEDPPEKEMATHSSILVWRISWAEEPGRLQSIASQRAGHD